MITKRLKGLAINAFLGDAGDRIRHTAADVRRRLAGEPRRVDFYHDVTDPWSHLAAQAAQRLAATYPIELAFHVVAPPASDVNGQPELRLKYAIRDAMEIASHRDLDFPGRKNELDPAWVRKASQVLIKQRPAAEHLQVAIDLGTALWAGDGKAITALMGVYRPEASGAVPPILEESYAALRARGHYQGAMFAYGGDWYWGVDRLPLLEARLQADLGGPPPIALIMNKPASARPPERLAPGDGPLVVDFWFSFRSPYSYLALERLAAIAARWPIELKIRPVAPMVQRGIPLPSDKRMYIARDAKRIADREGIPFGVLCDPLGAGVDHCLAIAHAATLQGQGKALDFLRSAGRGIWAEALDVANYVELRTIVERAGMKWDDARAAIADPAWREVVASNAIDLGTYGLWGVPSFRAGTYIAWGQDRLDFLEDRIRRHVEAVALAPTPAKAPDAPAAPAAPAAT